MELIQISAGRGPVECSRAVYHVSKRFIKDAHKNGFSTSIVSIIKDYEKNTFKSVSISLTGKRDINSFLSPWEGSILWVEKSPFRPSHKRKNWFVSLNKIKINLPENFDLQKIRFDTMRSSGAGGQHTNKTESGVRATHTPTGISVTITAERSQHRNKAIALAILNNKLEEINIELAKKNEKRNWQKHNELIRGNPIRTFK